MKVAKKAGALLSFDPNLRLQLWDSPKDARALIMRIWKQSNIIKVSDAEVEFLTSKDTEEDDAAVMSLWHSELKLLVVTLGGKGCKYYTKDFRGTVKGLAVKPMDTTGAGDAFVGGMLRKIADDQSALQDEKKLREVLRFANACGAITTTKRGAIPALPNEAEVWGLLEKA
ncbi:putative fructokinase-8 [Phoenix dactylifera]|uniref:Fructokinase-8 n=1 Tax=Phoenix dactylifera TaxID=42345 RepID=A0A8B9AUH8_PHODC|nr:putative fructokinase-8 [Phoenix dactylifera]